MIENNTAQSHLVVVGTVGRLAGMMYSQIPSLRTACCGWSKLTADEFNEPACDIASADQDRWLFYFISFLLIHFLNV